MNRSARPLIVSLSTLCLTAAGCGGSSKTSAPSATHTAPSATPNGVVEVQMKNIKFVPHVVVVRLGQTVRWTNNDSVAHTVASSTLRLASEAITQGKTFTYRPKRAGTFAYFCTIHANQNGTLIVRPAAG